MPTAIFVHDGDAIDYTPGADVAAGDVIVQGELVAVSKRDIPSGTPGSLAVTGVYDFPKATGGGEGIAAGVDVYWDATGEVATTDDAVGVNKKIGRTVAAAGDSDATVRVRMSQ